MKAGHNDPLQSILLRHSWQRPLCKTISSVSLKEQLEELPAISWTALPLDLDYSWQNTNFQLNKSAFKWRSRNFSMLPHGKHLNNISFQWLFIFSPKFPWEALNRSLGTHPVCLPRPPDLSMSYSSVLPETVSSDLRHLLCASKFCPFNIHLLTTLRVQLVS